LFPVIVTFTVMGKAEVGRPMRFFYFAFGAWLVIAPWVLAGARSTASWIGVLIGVAVMVLSLPRGKRSKEHYGDWDRYVV
ncbi:MAG: SPW repeat protein, partial [Variovorax sp.]